MYACVILHNMIVEDERDTYTVRYDHDYESEYDQLIGFGHGPIHGFSRVLEIEDGIQDQDMQQRLKDDLVEHIWQRFRGNQS